MNSDNTPMERLAALTTQLVDKHVATANEIKELKEEVSSLREVLKNKDDEIAKMGDELLEKDIEIEEIVSKLESLLG
jgi:predicted  nucleic acid-binding Zn-ribbon protein